MKRALTTEELFAVLVEDPDCQNADSMAVVYVSSEIDVSDEEEIDENIIGKDWRRMLRARMKYN